MTDADKKWAEAMDAAKPKDLHFQCGDYSCAAHKSWAEGADFGRQYFEKELSEARSEIERLLKDQSDLWSARAAIRELKARAESLSRHHDDALLAFKNNQKAAIEWKARSERYRAALEHYESAHYDHRGDSCFHDDTATKALSDAPKNEGGERD